jgi:hypothetical protein
VSGGDTTSKLFAVVCSSPDSPPENPWYSVFMVSIGAVRTEQVMLVEKVSRSGNYS